MRVCVLGGGGSFGLLTSDHFLDQIDERGEPVVERLIGIGRSGPKAEVFQMGIGHDDPRYSYFSYHIGYELDLMLELLDREEPDTVISFAAQGESGTSYAYSWRYFQTNCVDLVRLIGELQKRSYLKHFLQIGSSEVYGSTQVPATEDMPLAATSPYAISKGAFDQYLGSVAGRLPFAVSILRPSNCFGRGQQLHRVVPKTILYGLTGRKIPLHGGGKAAKSYLVTQDMSEAAWRIAQAPNRLVYNCGPDQAISIRLLVEKIAAALQIPFDQLVEEAPERAHQDSVYWLDSTRIKTDYGWEPKISLEDGLAEMVDWVRSNLSELSQQPVEFRMRG